MVRTVCLGEEDHAVNMLRSLKQMKYEHDLCDFIIKVGSDVYPTHQNILSAGSPYFKAMFKHVTAESRDGKVEMKDVDSECVKSCIEFLYSGSFDIPDGKIDQLLHVATMLQLDKVKNAVSDVLFESLNAGNFYETRDIAEMYNIQTVSKKCETFYQDNLLTISSEAGFRKEKKSNLIKMLKSKKLNEEEKLTIILRWVNLKKKENLVELIKLVELRDVPHPFLRELLKNHPVISNDLRLYKLINDPLIEIVDKNARSITDDSNNQILMIADDPNSKKLIVLLDLNADCLRSYDPASNVVTEYHDEKFKHLGNFTAVSMDSYIYVLCGDKSVHRLNFKDKSSNWERMRDMIADHGVNPSVVALSGSLFVVGSSYLGPPTKVVEKFDPAANRWLKLKNKPEAICSAALVSLNDSIFCIGGWNNRSSSSNSFCRFTPATSEWVNLVPMKNAKYTGIAVGQRIFVMAGGRTQRELNEVECYDVKSGTWTALSGTIEPHGHSAAHHVDGWIFLVSRSGNSNEVEKYDIANDRWHKVEFKDAGQFKIYDSVLV